MTRQNHTHPPEHLRLRDAVRCRFYARTPVGGGYHYEDITPNGRDGWLTLHPPAVGDIVGLSDGSGVWKVVARSWEYSAFDSGAWPYDENLPTRGPILQVIVERAEGLFIDEVSDGDGDE